MRLSSKILGAGLILTGTALAGCNCCDSGRQTTSSRNPTSGQTMASNQQTAGRTSWGNPAGQPNQSPIARTGAAGQPVYSTQQASWNSAPAAASGGTVAGDMNSRTNAPAIPVTPTQTGIGTSPTSSAATYGTPVTTPGTYNTQPASAASFGTGTTTTPGAYSASPGSTGAYGSSAGHVPSSTASPTSTTPTSDTSSPRRLDLPSNTGSAITPSASPSNAPVYSVSGSGATSQPSSTSADPSSSGTANTASPATSSPAAMPTVTGSAKGFGN